MPRGGIPLLHVRRYPLPGRDRRGGARLGWTVILTPTPHALTRRPELRPVGLLGRCGPPDPRSSSWPRSWRWSWGLAYGGGAAPLAIGDPGAFVRWGLPDGPARSSTSPPPAWSGASSPRSSP